jgi:hypothetical protein
MPLRGGQPRNLSATLDRSIENGAWADLVMAEDVPGPVWTSDGSIVTLVGDHGRNVPYRFTPGRDPAPLLEADQLVGAGLAANGERIALSAGMAGRAGELYALEECASPPGR